MSIWFIVIMSKLLTWSIKQFHWSLWNCATSIFINTDFVNMFRIRSLQLKSSLSIRFLQTVWQSLYHVKSMRTFCSCWKCWIYLFTEYFDDFMSKNDLFQTRIQLKKNSFFELKNALFLYFKKTILHLKETLLQLKKTLF